MDLLLADLDVQLLARLSTYQHALTSGSSFDWTRQTRATRQRRKRQEGERREWDDREVA